METVKKIALLIAWFLIIVAIPAHGSHYDFLMDSVVGVKTATGSGTGVLIEPGKVLTAKHVVENQDKVRVWDYTGKDHKVTKIVYIKDHDAAFLFVEGLPHSPASTICVYHPGEPIIIIGHEYFPTKTPPDKLVITWLFRRGWLGKVFTDSYMVLDASAGPGMSGSPVFNASGELIGIVIYGLLQDPRSVGKGLVGALTTRDMGLCNGY